MNVDLAIALTGDSSDVEGAFDKAASSASDYGNAVDSAADKADGAASRIGSVGDSADNVDSKAAAATGSLGALSSGFELIGAEGAAAGLQSAAMATDFLSGAGQGLNLILQSQVVQTNLARAATIGKTVADKAMAVGTKVAAAGQWALNAAMSANPIGLVVLAVAALVAGFIIAYNKSETFRSIVKGAMDGAKTAIGFVVDKVGDIAGKVKEVTDKIPSIGSAAEKVKSVAVTAFDLITAPVKALVGFIQDIIDKLGQIKFPSPPPWVDKLFRTSADMSTTGYVQQSGATELFTPAVTVRTAGGGLGSDQRPVVINITESKDGRQTARELIQALRREGVLVQGVA